MSMRSLANRLQYNGGVQSLDRIKQQKLRSLQSALKNDYNSRLIKTPLHEVWSCLINTNNQKVDYDKKYISIEFASRLEAGDVFEILDDNTHWMVYLPILTETAYLRAEIIRCRYQLEVDGENYWIYFQGPTETDLRWFIKNGVNYNELNLSGTIYIKNTPKTKEYFKRFRRLKIDGHTWEVQVTDSITVPGIMELEVQEYYDNSIEELPEILKEDAEVADHIIGRSSSKPNTIVGYQILPTFYNPNAEWKISGNDRVKVQEVMEDGRICKVKIYPGAIGSYIVSYGDCVKEVEVDWEQPIIQGPQSVYPYDTHTYFLEKNMEGIFFVESDLAKVIEQDGNRCKVEIVSGKKGNFILYCELTKVSYDDEILPIDDIELEEPVEEPTEEEEPIEEEVEKVILELPITIGSL